MDRSSPFDEKIAKLTNEVEGGKIDTAGTSFSCGNAVLITGAAVPIVVGVVFCLIKPKFIMKKEGETTSINMKKLLQWTLIITLILWVALYIYSYYKTSIMCLISR